MTLITVAAVMMMLVGVAGVRLWMKVYGGLMAAAVMVEEEVVVTVTK